MLFSFIDRQFAQFFSQFIAKALYIKISIKKNAVFIDLVELKIETEKEGESIHIPISHALPKYERAFFHRLIQQLSRNQTIIFCNWKISQCSGTVPKERWRQPPFLYPAGGIILFFYSRIPSGRISQRWLRVSPGERVNSRSAAGCRLFTRTGSQWCIRASNSRLPCRPPTPRTRPFSVSRSARRRNEYVES